MHLVLCQFDESRHLLERWLWIHQNSDDVTLVTSETSLLLATKLKEQFESIKDVVILEEHHHKIEGTTRLTNLVNSTGTRKIILPISLKNGKLRFVENTFIPLLAPIFPIVRKLWLFGLREFEIFNLNGSQTLTVPNLLDSFVDIHRGSRCFVVGNGPSLNRINMKLLCNEITLGANRCYLGYDKWGFAFSYWGIMDRLQIEEYWSEYQSNIPEETVKFFPFEYLNFLQFGNPCPINHLYSVPDFPQFSNSPEKVYLGYSVTYMLLQIAVMMGCNPVILIGVDHKYPLKKGKNNILTSQQRTSIRRWKILTKMATNLIVPFRASSFYQRLKQTYLAMVGVRKKQDAKYTTKYWNVSDARGPTHFDKSYTTGKRFVAPRPKQANTAFECAAEWANINGIDILNATPESALTAFPMIRYEDLF